MMDPTNAALMTLGLAILAMLVRDFFKSPKESAGEMVRAFDAYRVQNDAAMREMRERLDQLNTRMLREHFTKDETREVLREMRDAIERVQGAVERVQLAVERLNAARSSGSSGH